MKNLLLTLILLVIATPAVWAQDNRSILKVRLSDNSQIMINLNNRSYDETNRVITVANLRSGQHRLQIFVPDRYGRRRAVVYDGIIRIKPRTHNYVMVDRYRGTVRINTSRLEEDRYYEDGYKENDDRYERGGRHNSRGDEWNYGRGNVLSQRDMDDLERNVESRITDSDKFKAIKTALNDKSYTTEQVRTILKWLGFDSTRLDFAKWAYENVTDNRNYWRLESEFSFDSTKEEFNDFITSTRS